MGKQLCWVMAVLPKSKEPKPKKGLPLLVRQRFSLSKWRFFPVTGHAITTLLSAFRANHPP